MTKYTFSTAKLKNCRTVDGKAISSFSMRETDGQDEEIAANQAKARGGSATATEELIRLSIHEVNGEVVKQPYLEFDRWNSRVRSFAVTAWRNINAITDKESDDFLAQAQLDDIKTDVAENGQTG